MGSTKSPLLAGFKVTSGAVRVPPPAAPDPTTVAQAAGQPPQVETLIDRPLHPTAASRSVGQSSNVGQPLFGEGVAASNAGQPPNAAQVEQHDISEGLGEARSASLVLPHSAQVVPQSPACHGAQTTQAVPRSPALIWSVPGMAGPALPTHLPSVPPLPPPARRPHGNSLPVVTLLPAVVAAAASSVSELFTCHAVLPRLPPPPFTLVSTHLVYVLHKNDTTDI